MNMLDILKALGANTHLLSYVPEAQFRIMHEHRNGFLNTTIYVRESWPKFLKALVIPLIVLYGLKYAKKSDIILSIVPTMVSGFPAMVVARIFRKPLIVDHTDSREPDTPRFIYDSVLKSSTIVFAISHYLEKEARDKGCKRVAYVPIFVDTSVFRRDVGERRTIRKELRVGKNEVVIGYAGSFWDGEGVAILLKAFRNLTKRHENARLMVIGGGRAEESHSISRLVAKLRLKEKVSLIPLQPYKSIPRYLSACDIACSPKIDCQENRAANPAKIYEYMSMGLPVVVSAVGEITNVIENGVNGFLVKPGDEDDLERTLGYAIQNLQAVKEVGKRAREKVINNYSQRAAQERIGEIFRQEFTNTAQKARF